MINEIYVTGRGQHSSFSLRDRAAVNRPSLLDVIASACSNAGGDGVQQEKQAHPREHQ